MNLSEKYGIFGDNTFQIKKKKKKKKSSFSMALHMNSYQGVTCMV